MASFETISVSRSAAGLLALLLAAALAGCGDDSGNGGTTGGETSFDTAEQINTHLEGKTLTMQGDAIPSHPNGFDENINFGSATQCYNSVTMMPSSTSWHVTSILGTLSGAPNPGDVGMCDRTTPSSEISFDSTAILIENVSGGGGCFDFTATYVGFSQEGRGGISADGRTFSLEIFFGGQASGHRCSDGGVGDASVQLSGMPFTGDAVQVYTVQ